MENCSPFCANDVDILKLVYLKVPQPWGLGLKLGILDPFKDRDGIEIFWRDIRDSDLETTPWMCHDKMYAITNCQIKASRDDFGRRNLKLMVPFFLPSPAINLKTFNFAFDKLIKRNFHISISWDSLIISRVVKKIPL